MAAQASASSHVGAVVALGTTVYEVDVSATDDTSITYVLNPIGGGVPVTSTVSYTAQPCNMLQASDGLQLGWSVVAVWIGVYVIRLMARVFRGETGGDYGNA